MNRRATSSALVVAGVLVLATGSAQAAPGDLDPSFGTGGVVTTAIGSGNDYVNAVAIQPDGKIVAAGHSYNGSDFDFSLVRYNADGSLDSSFGPGGKVTTPIGPGYDYDYAVALQPDGKIVVAGYAFNGGTDDDYALARYNADGSLDTSFGTGGKVTVTGAADEGAQAVVIQPDGKIVAAGFASVGSNYLFGLARFNSDGSLDASFGSGGKVTTAVGPDDDEISGLILQPDGKLVAAGDSATGGSNDDFALARYNSDGSLDSAFGSGGKVTTDFGSNVESASDLVLQEDGKLVAAGDTKVGSTFDFALSRYNADGSLDSGFGSGGKVTTAIGSGNDIVSAVAVQPDGRIVAAGVAHNGTDYDFGLARYNSDGSLDSSFGTGGKVTTPIGSNHDFANAVALQPDGKILAAGNRLDAGGTNEDIALVRYLGSTLSVTKAGSGVGTVTTSPAGIDCGSTCSAPFAAVPVTLTAAASTGSTFTGWSGDCSGTGACTLTMSADHSVTATFETDKTLTVSKSGSGSGSVSSTPSGISCGSSCSHAYAHGTSVKLTASASSRSKFSGWSGDCSGTGSCTLTISADHSATATFKVRCVVPKVKGKKLAAAKKAIKKAHCSVGKVTKAFSSKVKKGRVISQKPAAGKNRDKGSKVKLKVSKGPR